ncbi:hypothetical protein ABMA27_016898 [Loxostege sticticalis]|uniref:Reverse transcriptase domain-containing protein n=1 Tax=Loxostege sticticalis TaxID=481309 RepID=A0ABR3GYU0_LOXSC
MVEASRRKLAFALVQEPYVGGIRRMKDYRGARVYQNAKVGDGTVKAAIVVFDDDLDVIQCPKLTCDHIVAVRIRTSDWEIAAVSFYFEPDKPIGPYLDRLREVVEVLGPRRLLIGGDSNAKSAWWGSPEEDHRGADMSGTLEESGLHVLNRGTVPTFDTIRGGRRFTSHVDQTACTEDLLSYVENWRVDKGMIISDHSAITFNMSLKRGKGLRVMRTTRRYNTKKADWELFNTTLAEDIAARNFNLEEINRTENAQQIDLIVENFTNAVTNACRISIPSKKNSEVLKIPWWTEELTKLKRTTVTYRRKIRNAAPHNRDKAVEEYLVKKEEYERQAKIEQISSWKEFCSKQDREGLWEGIYRVISRTANREEDLPLTKNGRALDNFESATYLAETFYPEDTQDQEREHHRSIRALANQVNKHQHDEQLDPPFTLTELKTAMSSFNPKKAPGEDGFTADICSRAVFQDPDAFLALLNKCLSIGHFPSIWKRATVVVLRKPGKDDYTNPKAYRPIGLLPVLGKVLEKMTVARMKWHLIPRFSTRQYGFMPQKSTEDALYNLVHRIQGKIELKKLVTLVSLDIEGAFDSAWWPAIRIRLAEERCPVNVRRLLDSYLEHRSVKLRYAGEEVGRGTNKGCVQGSIGGPILWNLLLDPLLQELEKRGHYVQAFADDVIMVFDGETALEIETEANAALLFVSQWGVQNKLRFAPHKTGAMTLTRKLIHDTPHISMGGVDVGMLNKIKILGLTIDHKLTFNDHIATQTRKALDIYKQIARAAKETNEKIKVNNFSELISNKITRDKFIFKPVEYKMYVSKNILKGSLNFSFQTSSAIYTLEINLFDTRILKYYIRRFTGLDEPFHLTPLLCTCVNAKSFRSHFSVLSGFNIFGTFYSKITTSSAIYTLEINLFDTLLLKNFVRTRLLFSASFYRTRRALSPDTSFVHFDKLLFLFQNFFSVLRRTKLLKTIDVDFSVIRCIVLSGFNIFGTFYSKITVFQCS